MSSLRSRLALASGLVVLVVLAGVCAVLFTVYSANLGAQTDAALVHAADQAASVAMAVKERAPQGVATTDLSTPLTVEGAQVQIIPAPVEGGSPAAGPGAGPGSDSGAGPGSDSGGSPGPLGALTTVDVQVAYGKQAPYFRTTSGPGPLRVYTARLTQTSGAVLVRVWRPVSADSAARTRAGLLLAGATLAGTAVAAAAGRLGAGRVLRPIGELTLAAEQVARAGDPAVRIRPGTRGPGDEVGRLAAAFDTMLAELEQSIGAQRQLVADGSHELRTPLTSVITNLDLLGDGPGLADPQAPRLVADARAQAGELVGLVEDLVDLARYGHGQLEPHREDVRLDEIADAVLRRAAGRLPRGIRLESRLEPCLVTADPAAADRALGNLVDNAVKWSPDRGVVRVEVEAGRCRVVDQGPGIPAADLPHVFERFYRAQAARSLPGSGLGLAIVAQVAERNDGWVRAESGPGGSTFTLAFPLAPGPQPGEGQPGEGRPGEGRPGEGRPGEGRPGVVSQPR